MSADYQMAVTCLQENLVRLDGNRTPEQTALWNVSNALLVVCDALREQDARLQKIEIQTTNAR